MFKDLYKNANDRIPTDDAYRRVMAKVQSGQKKSKHSYARFISLAACFLLTVSMIPVYENYKSQNSKNFEVITPSDPKPAVLIPAQENQPVIAEDSSENKPVSKPVTISPTNIVKNQGIPEGIMLATARLYSTGDVYTSEEYSAYLGKDIEETVVLPETFKNESPTEQILSLDTGEDCIESFNDEWTYYFTDDESSVFISTTKKTEEIENIIENDDYTKSTISGFDAVIFEEDVQKIAYMVAEDIGYTVTGIDVSDETFENLLISLVK